MRLADGIYRTEKGSELDLSRNGGRASLDFDWLEEGACVDCRADPYPQYWGDGEFRLVWQCDCCGGGSARLLGGRAMKPSCTTCKHSSGVHASLDCAKHGGKCWSVRRFNCHNFDDWEPKIEHLMPDENSIRAAHLEIELDRRNRELSVWRIYTLVLLLALVGVLAAGVL